MEHNEAKTSLAAMKKKTQPVRADQKIRSFSVSFVLKIINLRPWHSV
jgi:hypothetical protein